MNKLKITPLLLTACVLWITSSCALGSTIENTQIEPDPSVPLASASTANADIDGLFESRIQSPELPPDEKPDEVICTDYVDRGLLRICYVSKTDARLKLQVLKDNATIAYNLKGDGSIEDFSLQYGNGEYTARIMQNIKNNEYVVVESKSFTIELADETVVYLNSIQNVDWDYDDKPIRDVRFIISDSLVKQSDDNLKFSSTNDLYQYVITHIEYDSEKIFDLLYDYLPDIEQTYRDETAICYDYAALFGSMLRSIGIPAKLVKGYNVQNPDVYHAWNEVFIKGEWIVVDTTLDSSSAGLSLPMEKNAEDYAKVYEY